MIMTEWVNHNLKRIEVLITCTCAIHKLALTIEEKKQARSEPIKVERETLVQFSIPHKTAEKRPF